MTNYLETMDPLLLRYIFTEFVDCRSLVQASGTSKYNNELIQGKDGVTDELLHRVSPLLTTFKSSASYTTKSGSSSSLKNGRIDPLHAINFYEEIRKAKASFLVSCGENHTILYLPNQRRLMTFGLNESGQLGQGSLESSAEPREVLIPAVFRGEETVKSVIGGTDHSLVLLESNKLFGFGSNTRGQLGPIVPDESILSPVELGFNINKNVSMISCAFGYSAILLGDEQGTVVILGTNTGFDLEPLKGSEKFFSLARGEINSTDKVTSISAGYHHLLLLTKQGKVYAVGANSFGQLGVGNVVESSSAPMEVLYCSVEDPIAQVAAGENHSVLLTRDGRVLTFGDGRSGQLGNGIFRAVNPSPSEVKLNKETFPIIVTCGNNHTVLLDIDGNVTTFGENSFQQTGTASPFFAVNRPMKVAIKGRFRDLVHIAAGKSHTAVFGVKHDLVMFGRKDVCNGDSMKATHFQGRRNSVMPYVVNTSGKAVPGTAKISKVYYTSRFRRTTLR